MSRKIIPSCAIAGSIHVPSMGSCLPLILDEIATSSIGAARAGALILHLYAHDPEAGRPSADMGVFRQFLSRIRKVTDAVINITTGGSSQMMVAQCLSGPAELPSEMCSLNIGSMNSGLSPMKERQNAWKHVWEELFLEKNSDLVFKNAFKDIEAVFDLSDDKASARFEFECSDPGHIQTVDCYLKKEGIKAPILLQFAIGVLGGITASAQSLLMTKETADGLEDSLMIARAELAHCNAQQVTKIRKLSEELGLDIASRKRSAMSRIEGADKGGF